MKERVLVLVKQKILTIRALRALTDLTGSDQPQLKANFLLHMAQAAPFQLSHDCQSLLQ